MSPLVPGLIEIRRSVVMAEIGAARRYVALTRPGLRIYVVETRGLVVDSRMLGAAIQPLYVTSPAIGHLTIPLAGAFVARRGRELVVRPGKLLLDPPRQVDERWEGPIFRALCVEWDASFGPRGVTSDPATIDQRDLARFRASADAIVDGALGSRELDALLELFAAHGLIDRAAHGLAREPAPARAHAFARSVNALFTSLDAHPDLTDLEDRLHLSSRHIRRTLHELGAWSAVHGGSLRGALRRIRTWLAPSLATARGATVERVASALGYRSRQALLLALRQEGVPPLRSARAVAEERST